MARNAYKALYKGLMNINEDGRPPHGWHGLDGDQGIKRDTPTVSLYALHFLAQHKLFSCSNIT